MAQAAPPAPRRPPTPIMAIIFEGQVHRIKVYPGPEGKARFQQQIRDLVQLGEDEEFEVEFECKAPDSGEVCSQHGFHQQPVGGAHEVKGSCCHKQQASVFIKRRCMQTVAYVKALVYSHARPWRAVSQCSCAQHICSSSPKLE